MLYMPGLIEAGKLYKSIPPLYGIKQGKTTKYFATTADYTKYIQGIFLSKYSFADMNGNKISYGQATSIFYRNRNYIQDITIASDNLAIDPDLLESVLYELAPYIEIGSNGLVQAMAAKSKATKKTTSKKAKDTAKKIKKENPEVSIDESSLDDEEEIEIPVSENSVVNNIPYYIKPEFNFKTMANNLKKKYRFLSVERKNGIIILNGLVNSRLQNVFINDRFINACIDLINTIKSNDEYYILNGQMVTIYGLMKAFDESAPSYITRYKGLGEQNADQLKDSAMDPNGSRTLVQYTMESANEEINSIRHIESNMYSLLREIKVDRSEVE